MNSHRLFFSFILFLIIIYLTSSLECDEHSTQDDIPFFIKVHQSPFILMGVSLIKTIDIDIPNLFNVTFLVQCILKGRPTKQIIHIVQAGSLLGRRSCQRLNINQEYIVFLESFYDGTYRPVDFEEIPYDDQVNMLLGETCGLRRTYPFTESNDTEAMLTMKCPSTVSINCPLEPAKTTVVTSTTTTVLSTTTTTTTTTTSSVMLSKSTIDLALLSLLLAQHRYQNLSSVFKQEQNHKSLFSDDDIRKNQANQLSFMIIFSSIQFIFCSIFYRFL